MRAIAISAAIALAMVSGVGHAQSDAPKASAIVIEMSGSVMVNTGEQFVAVPDGTAVNVGDRVMALDDSGALLRYSDGCDVKVAAGTVVTLNEGSPCAGWVLAVDPASSAGIALGSTAGTAGTVGGISPWIYVPVAIVAGVLIYDELDDSSSSP